MNVDVGPAGFYTEHIQRERTTLTGIHSGIVSLDAKQGRKRELDIQSIDTQSAAFKQTPTLFQDSRFSSPYNVHRTIGFDDADIDSGIIHIQELDYPADAGRVESRLPRPSKSRIKFLARRGIEISNMDQLDRKFLREIYISGTGKVIEVKNPREMNMVKRKYSKTELDTYIRESVEGLAVVAGEREDSRAFSTLLERAAKLSTKG